MKAWIFLLLGFAIARSATGETYRFKPYSDDLFKRLGLTQSQLSLDNEMATESLEKAYLAAKETYAEKDPKAFASIQAAYDSLRQEDLAYRTEFLDEISLKEFYAPGTKYPRLSARPLSREIVLWIEEISQADEAWMSKAPIRRAVHQLITKQAGQLFHRLLFHGLGQSSQVVAEIVYLGLSLRPDQDAHSFWKRAIEASDSAEISALFEKLRAGKVESVLLEILPSLSSKTHAPEISNLVRQLWAKTMFHSLQMRSARGDGVSFQSIQLVSRLSHLGYSWLDEYSEEGLLLSIQRQLVEGLVEDELEPKSLRDLKSTLLLTQKPETLSMSRSPQVRCEKALISESQNPN